MGLFSVIDLASGKNNEEAKNFISSEEFTDWFPVLPELAEAVDSAVAGKGTDLSGLGEGLKRFLSDYKKEQKQNMTVLAGLISFKSYFLTGDVKAWASLEALSHNSSIPTWVAELFFHDVKPQRNIKRTLESVVKQMTGLNQSTVPTEDAEKLKKKFPELYSLRRDKYSAYNSGLVRRGLISKTWKIISTRTKSKRLGLRDLSVR